MLKPPSETRRSIEPIELRTLVAPESEREWEHCGVIAATTRMSCKIRRHLCVNRVGWQLRQLLSAKQASAAEEIQRSVLGSRRPSELRVTRKPRAAAFRALGLVGLRRGLGSHGMSECYSEKHTGADREARSPDT